MHAFRLFAVLLIFSLVCVKAHANDTERAWQQLAQGKAIALIRHALAPGMSDPSHFLVTDCSTQRLLSEEGREQAVRIGELFRAQGIAEANLLSSQWCRCLDTARLLDLGEVKEFDALNSFFENRSFADKQTAEVLAKMPNWVVGADLPTVLVTHQVNISALTSTPTASGEIVIIALENDTPKVLARIPTR